MSRQVFLGGACGSTTWRRDIAIPALDVAGITYHNPQLGPGEWTPAHEILDMEAKAAAKVLLFVISGSTRGIAGIAEVSYLLAAGRALALVIEDVPTSAMFDGRPVEQAERNDLNRGRLFVRTMAIGQSVPVFAEVAEATAHAIQLVRGLAPCVTMEQARAVLQEVNFGNREFVLEEVADGFQLFLQQRVVDVVPGTQELQPVRKWFLPRGVTRDEIVQTAFKAAVTWAEHETRELFTYQSARVFSPHLSPGRLVAATRDAKD